MTSPDKYEAGNPGVVDSGQHLVEKKENSKTSEARTETKHTLFVSPQGQAWALDVRFEKGDYKADIIEQLWENRTNLFGRTDLTRFDIQLQIEDEFKNVQLLDVREKAALYEGKTLTCQIYNGMALVTPLCLAPARVLLSCGISVSLIFMSLDLASGLPPLAPRFQFGSLLPENRNHRAAYLQESNFVCLDGLVPNLKKSLIWQNFRQSPDRELKWTNEIDIRDLVKLVIMDAIVALDLAKELNCFYSDQRYPYIWIVKDQNPLGVIAVQTPGVNMSSAFVHGQIYDCMTQQSRLYKQKWIFGIVTTYQEWRFYWLENSHGVAQDSKPAKGKPREGTERIKNIFCIPQHPHERTTADPIIPPAEDKRELYGTKVIRFNDSTLFSILASVLLKMYWSP